MSKKKNPLPKSKSSQTKKESSEEIIMDLSDEEQSESESSSQGRSSDSDSEYTPSPETTPENSPRTPSTPGNPTDYHIIDDIPFSPAPTGQRTGRLEPPSTPHVSDTVRIDNSGTLTGRGPVNLGSHQGDHVTAYAMYEEAVQSILKKTTNPGEQIHQLLLFSNDVLDPAVNNDLSGSLRPHLEEFQEKINKRTDAKNKLSKALEGKEELLETLEILAGDSDKQMQKEQKSVSHKLTRVIMTQVNQLPLVSVPKQGNLGADDKDRETRGAISKLRKLNNDEINPNNRTTYIVDNLYALFHYPKIPDQSLIDPKSNEWKSIKDQKKYPKNAKPRDNDLNNLATVTERHLSVAFNAFPKLFPPRERSELVNAFLDHVNEQGGWNLQGDDLTKFKLDVAQSLADKGLLTKAEFQKIKESTKQEKEEKPRVLRKSSKKIVGPNTDKLINQRDKGPNQGKGKGNGKE